MFNAARITEGKQTHSAAPDGGIIRFQLMAALGLEGRLFYPQNCCLFVVGAFFFPASFYWNMSTGQIHVKTS